MTSIFLMDYFTTFQPAEFLPLFVKFSEGQESGYPSSFGGYFIVL